MSLSTCLKSLNLTKSKPRTSFKPARGYLNSTKKYSSDGKGKFTSHLKSRSTIFKKFGPKIAKIRAKDLENSETYLDKNRGASGYRSKYLEEFESLKKQIKSNSSTIRRKKFNFKV